MRFQPTRLPGVFVIEPVLLTDERGFFARSWCKQELAAHGLCTEIAQCSISFNRKRGTLRGLHYQAPPHAENKIVRCKRGAIFDVALDLRSDSRTFCQWHGVELTEKNYRMLYIPAGCAHGFQTLANNSEVEYFISTAYEPAAARGVRWNEPAFGIEWPIREPVVLSERDANYPDFDRTCPPF
jgi:dTDP-4-dehydrorhamnose 3,5-epimerase